MSLSSKVCRALTSFREVTSLVSNASTAAASAVPVAASALRASIAGDELLAQARFRRAEALQKMSIAERGRAELVLDILLDNLYCTEEQDSLGSSVHAGLDIRLASWNQPSSSWWLEKLVGLRWRTVELSDVLCETCILKNDCRDLDYMLSVREAARRWTLVMDTVREISLWVKDWEGIANLASAGRIGDQGILIHSP
jgi:hypothetical protein